MGTSNTPIIALRTPWDPRDRNANWGRSHEDNYKLSLMALCWVPPALIALVAVQQAHKSIFQPLSAEDRAQVAFEVRRALFQAALALIVFREPIGWRVLYAILPSLVLRYLHSVVGFSLQAPQKHTGTGALLCILHVCDMVWAHYWAGKIWSTSGCAPLTLALLADIVVLWGQLLMHTGQFWYPQDKLGRYIVNAYSCFLQLCVYISLAGLMASHWYLPVHIAGDAWRTLRLVVSHLGRALRHKRAFEVYKLKQTTTASACPICLETDGELFVETCCMHEMHLSCIYEWLDSVPQCPVCRTPLRTSIPPSK